ncbi:type II toxin-antitoxin system HicA family toxin [Candidatus Micrarchaeota archaeon]|nr:type II toxin-antitoxin system HicA family toxin [Candidatus Micrarchaeota archaeon]
MVLSIASGKEVLRLLLKQGFIIVRQRGSHVQLVKQLIDKTIRVTVPIHGSRDLPPSVMRSIIKQAGYTVDELVKLFGR